MRHRKRSRRLVTKWEHRVSLMRNQVTDLLRHGRITTTLAKAKELRRVADRMITLAKRGDLASRRRALAFIRDKAVVRKLFTELREKYMDRPGGYTRIVKIGPRRGDAAMMAIVELVEEKLQHKRSRRKIEAERKAEKEIERALGRGKEAEEVSTSGEGEASGVAEGPESPPAQEASGEVEAQEVSSAGGPEAAEEKEPPSESPPEEKSS
ncbi:50S ribosomal protein L17 [Thermosulfurimonas marina]|uniref:Large ribosomal subunit protein bL17 n=1 Tax=Thermosulfurimonas marina TaxID=2047767 RepID=A0A6H1WR97_9BACT|nr:50S ribosomal protein L17 [Thermosulfurimonas marina]